MTLPTDFAGLTAWWVATDMVGGCDGGVIGSNLTVFSPPFTTEWIEHVHALLDGNGNPLRLASFNVGGTVGATFAICAQATQAAAQVSNTTGPYGDESTVAQLANDSLANGSPGMSQFLGGAPTSTHFTMYLVQYPIWYPIANAAKAPQTYAPLMGDEHCAMLYANGANVGAFVNDHTAGGQADLVNSPHIEIVAPPVNTWSVLEMTLDAGTLSIRSSTGASASVGGIVLASTAWANRILRVYSSELNFATNALMFNGYTSEMATYNTALSLANRNALMTYFGTSRGCVPDCAAHLTRLRSFVQIIG